VTLTEAAFTSSSSINCCFTFAVRAASSTTWPVERSCAVALQPASVAMERPRSQAPYRWRA
jgi:hypothetical protein